MEESPLDDPKHGRRRKNLVRHMLDLIDLSRNTIRGVVGRWTTRPDDDSPEREITMKNCQM